jgi:hypothetical protein
LGIGGEWGGSEADQGKSADPEGTTRWAMIGHFFAPDGRSEMVMGLGDCNAMTGWAGGWPWGWAALAKILT